MSVFRLIFSGFPSHIKLKIVYLETRVVWVGNKRYSNQILCPDFKLNWSVSNFKLLGIDFSLDLSSMPDLNFRKKIIDYMFIIYHTTFRVYIKSFKPFANRRTKIKTILKRNTLIADFEDGGLKMIHLQQFNAYLKISWIKRFFSNLKGGWQKIMAKNIKYYGGERIFSLQKEKILEISKIFSK
jgi:hypothetical protein